MPAHGLEGGEQPVIGQAEVEDHERLGGGTPAAMSSGSSATGSSCWPVMTALSAEIDGRLPLRPRLELAHARQQRARALVRDAGARVVEGEERGRAAERGGHAVLEEPIRLIIGREPGVGVDVHAAGQDEHPGRVDRLGSALPGQVGTDGADPPVGHGNVGVEDRSAVTTVPPRTTRSVNRSLR